MKPERATTMIEAELAGAGTMMDAWDKHERHVGRVLVGAGRPDRWQTIYRAYCTEQDLLYEAGDEWRFIE